MSKAIYLINPASDFPTYYGAESFAGRGLKAATVTADLTITTVAGMVPPDFDVVLCDENISQVDLDCPADFVGLTGKISQRGRLLRLAQEFRERGKVVLIGGPYASLCPEFVRPYCDILVRGEAEEMAGELFSDLRASRWKDEYVGGKPDLSLCVQPRWDLYPNERALTGTIQTSRGCPFQCEFCDVIQYVGRKQRHKPIPQILSELDELYRVGYRGVFIADDNFTANRGFVKSLLVALRDWNRRQVDGRMSFNTQVSIDAARDSELLEMCAEAGMTNVFIGIETPNEESLRETKKRQNLGVNLSEQIQRFLDHGIEVEAGMIVGFDSDGPDIFRRQYQFAMTAPVPIFSLGALVAPAATPLHARMEREGRLALDGSEVAAMPWSTNILPQQMTREQLLSGIQWLCNSIYHPEVFAERVLNFIDKLRPHPANVATETRAVPREIDIDVIEMIGKLAALGDAEAEMISRIVAKAGQKPEVSSQVASILLVYAQIRYMYEQGSFWDYRLASSAAPAFTRPDSLPVLPQSSHLNA